MKKSKMTEKKTAKKNEEKLKTKAIGSSLLSRGISERKKAENLLREGEEKYRTILQEVDEGFWLVDLQGRLLEVNDAYCLMSGYRRDELLKMNIPDLEFKEKSEEVASHIEKIIEKGGGKFESKHRRKDGSIIDVEVNVKYRSTDGGTFACFIHDITERKNIENSLMESERLLREAQSLVHIGSWSWTIKTDMVIWSNELYKINGFDPKLPAPSYARLASHYTKESWEILSKAVGEAVSRGTDYQLDLEIVRPDGQHRFTRAIGHALKNEFGDVDRLYGTVQDVTEQKQGEKKIKESEIKYRTLTESSSDCIKIFDMQGNLTFISSGGKREHNLKTEGELKNFKAIDTIIEEDKPRFIKAFEEAKMGKGSIIETRHAKEGSNREFCSEMIHPIEDGTGKIVGVLGVSRDITESKRVEAKEKTDEDYIRRLTFILDVAPSAVMVHDFEGNFIYINQRACKMHGYTHDELMKINLHKIDVPESEKLIALRMQKLRDEGEADFESFHYKKDGSSFPLEIHTLVTFWGDQKVILSISNDITERKKAEKDLNDARNKVSELQMTKNEFASIAAHQLRAPITTIIGFTSIFEEQMKVTALTDEQKKFIRDIEQSAKSMKELVNFLLKITRAESGKVKLALSPIDLRETVETTIEVLGSELDPKNQTVEISQDPFPFPFVFLDKEMIKEVVLNLLSNASRYSPDNSVIRVSMSLKDSYIEFFVKDNGMGIPKKEQSKMFEKFFRATNATAKVLEGTGLGLSLAKSLVEIWGGKIWFESEEGKGTTFYFTMPIVGKIEPSKDVVL